MKHVYTIYAWSFIYWAAGISIIAAAYVEYNPPWGLYIAVCCAYGFVMPRLFRFVSVTEERV